MKYVVAINQKEADEIARDLPELIHDTKASADAHLKEVKAPPTDPYYASQYRVYTVHPFIHQVPKPRKGRKT